MNRQQRRAKHKLIPAPHGFKSPIQGIVLRNNQKWYVCPFDGWASLSQKEPKEAFQTHVDSFQKEAASV